MTTDKIATITSGMLQEFKLTGIRDTTQNRLDFLTGMREAWREDETRSFEKSAWMIAISMEIGRLRRVLATQK